MRGAHPRLTCRFSLLHNEIVVSLKLTVSLYSFVSQERSTMQAIPKEQFDRMIDRHFSYEAEDDVEGVLSTMAPDVEHDVVGSPTGPLQGTQQARGFYDALFADLS